MNPLVEMKTLGQSPWHDNIKRELLISGKLAAMVEAGELTGLTSNPTIFEQAISGSKDYDRDLRRLANQGKTAEEIFYALAIEDIRNAADVFRRVFDETGGKDGFVSIECSPRLARDTDGTIREARSLWHAVDRRNLMVKIPATLEGLPAIEQSIADGLNINVTLIFSLERYDQVMDAYLRGLIRRHESGKSVDRIASVASFFVSRVDSLIDKLLEEQVRERPEDAERLRALEGKAAIANAKVAYQEFRKKFSTEAFAGLAKRGARVQRPLWASTSTKNPAYPDTYYVEALVGPDSVDTMPPATIEAYRDHGRPETRIDRDVEGARRVLEELGAAGIDMAKVTRQLEDEGVASFAKSFDSLIATVDERRRRIVATAKSKTKSGAKRPENAAKKKPSVKTSAKKTAKRKRS